MNNPYKTDFAALGLANHSPFAILKGKHSIPDVPNRPLSSIEKKKKQRESKRISMARTRLKEKALRVNLFSDSGTAKQHQADKDKSREIQASSNRYRTA